MQLYWVWFDMLEGISLRQKLTLLEHFSTPENIYNTNDYTQIPPEMAKALSDKDLKAAKTRINICNRRGIEILPFGDDAYPERLRNIADPPLILYYKGILPDFSRQPAIGVVGTRKATPYGLNTAKEISKQISECGGIIVSGGAKGIDAAALQGAVDAKAPSVAVLGSGVDVEYPYQNRPLFTKMREYGCLISEYPPGTKPAPWQFPARNRIISGMSNGVLVVEAPQVSGALITAKDALEQGRDVFVIPGNIDLPTFVGSNSLLREGATAVFSGWDVVKEYAAFYPFAVEEIRHNEILAEPEAQLPDKKVVDIPQPNAYSVKENNIADLSAQEIAILNCLDHMPRPMDAVVAQAGLPAGDAMRIITKLAMKGLVINHPGKLISAKKQ